MTSAAKPILFSAPMVRAILAGTKSVTRRIVTVPWKGSRRSLPHEPYYVEEDGRLLVMCDMLEGTECTKPCEYADLVRTYHPGMKLWVKETWAMLTGNGHRVVYAADGDPMTCGGTEPVRNMKWSPSIFMRREDSRIELEVLSARVERLKVISDDDAKREGADPGDAQDGLRMPGDYRGAFRVLWDTVNGERVPWSKNPWVWRIAFCVANLAHADGVTFHEVCR